mmetsp:Transcript_21233/g.42974  ORF Transcript_21233/g.42974 Transcript_21233/m.42974 type:complete len:98 (-) Transcript_21233:136-429(-)
MHARAGSCACRAASATHPRRRQRQAGLMHGQLLPADGRMHHMLDLQASEERLCSAVVIPTATHAREQAKAPVPVAHVLLRVLAGMPVTCGGTDARRG